MDKAQSNIRLGIACIIASAFCFSLMSLFIRLSGDVPVMQKCFFRNAVAFVMAFVVMSRARQRFVVEPGNWKYMFIRAGAGTLGIFLNFYAVDHLAISDASILNKLSPFFAIIFSAFVLKEVARAGEWLAVIVAFIGAVFVIRPGIDMMASFPAIVGMLSGCFAGLAYTYLRKLRQRGQNGMSIVMFFSGFSSLCFLPSLIFDYRPIAPWQWFFLFMTGVAALGGQVFITKAYAYAPAKEISVYDFSNVVFSALWGFLFLSQIPDPLSVVGYIIIIGTAVVKWRISLKKGEESLEKIQE